MKKPFQLKVDVKHSCWVTTYVTVNAETEAEAAAVIRDFIENHNGGNAGDLIYCELPDDVTDVFSGGEDSFEELSVVDNGNQATIEISGVNFPHASHWDNQPSETQPQP